jgi:hypothetical protein
LVQHRFFEGRDHGGASPRGEIACIRRTGVLAKRNTPKKAWKFKRLGPPSAKISKKYRETPRHGGTQPCTLPTMDVASALRRGK